MAIEGKGSLRQRKQQKSMLRAHKIALDLNNKQRSHLSKCAGVSRFAYNWALAEWNAMHKARKADPSQRRLL